MPPLMEMLSAAMFYLQQQQPAGVLRNVPRSVSQHMSKSSGTKLYDMSSISRKCVVTGHLNESM
jgi:hypothetical protein